MGGVERASEAYGVFGRVGSDGSGEQSFGVEQRCVWHGATMAMDEWRVDKWMKNKNVETATTATAFWAVTTRIAMAATRL